MEVVCLNLCFLYLRLHPNKTLYRCLMNFITEEYDNLNWD